MSPTSLSSPALLKLFGFWLAVNVFIIHQLGGGDCSESYSNEIVSPFHNNSYRIGTIIKML